MGACCGRRMGVLRASAAIPRPASRSSYQGTSEWAFAAAGHDCRDRVDLGFACGAARGVADDVVAGIEHGGALPSPYLPATGVSPLRDSSRVAGTGDPDACLSAAGLHHARLARRPRGYAGSCWLPGVIHRHPLSGVGGIDDDPGSDQRVGLMMSTELGGDCSARTMKRTSTTCCPEKSRSPVTVDSDHGYRGGD
jgi:hypothetical protein